MASQSTRRRSEFSRYVPKSERDAAAAAAKAKLPKPKKKFEWGVEWYKVSGGATSLLVFGGITIVLLPVGVIAIGPMILAIGGLFTMVSGLIGEQGKW
ncbi:MAG: hypothetical protein KDA83_04065 [Planctomycetales bacterium]|nr:hypothetical protein [Planctomycetales bacterium]